MQLAAKDRCRDAEELFLRQRFDGCVYLLGFAAEMWLKIVCMTLNPLGSKFDDDVMTAMKKLKQSMRQRTPAVKCKDFHDLEFFVRCIEELRLRKGDPLPPPRQTELRSRMIQGIYEEWIVDMRYRRSNLTEVDAQSALENVWWIQSTWDDFT